LKCIVIAAIFDLLLLLLRNLSPTEVNLVSAAAAGSRKTALSAFRNCLSHSAGAAEGRKTLQVQLEQEGKALAHI
jgi:hypothetical protein